MGFIYVSLDVIRWVVKQNKTPDEKKKRIIFFFLFDIFKFVSIKRVIGSASTKVKKKKKKVIGLVNYLILNWAKDKKIVVLPNQNRSGEFTVHAKEYAKAPLINTAASLSNLFIILVWLFVISEIEFLRF